MGVEFLLISLGVAALAGLVLGWLELRAGPGAAFPPSVIGPLSHRPAAWIVAGLLAAGGWGAYLVIGGELWWWLGLAGVMPLAILMGSRAREGSEDGPSTPSATDGPWGAP